MWRSCPGRCHTGAKQKSLCRRRAPAVGGVRTPERGRTCQRCLYARTRMGGGGGRLHAPVVAGARTPGREGGHLTGWVPWLRPAHSLRAWVVEGGGGDVLADATPRQPGRGGGAPQSRLVRARQGGGTTLDRQGATMNQVPPAVAPWARFSGLLTVLTPHPPVGVLRGRPLPLPARGCRPQQRGSPGWGTQGPAPLAAVARAPPRGAPCIRHPPS